MDAEKINRHLETLSGDLPEKTREALRKAEQRNSLPSLRTLQAAARAKQIRVSELLAAVECVQ